MTYITSFFVNWGSLHIRLFIQPSHLDKAGGGGEAESFSTLISF